MPRVRFRAEIRGGRNSLAENGARRAQKNNNRPLNFLRTNGSIETRITLRNYNELFPSPCCRKITYALYREILRHAAPDTLLLFFLNFFRVFQSFVRHFPVGPLYCALDSGWSIWRFLWVDSSVECLGNWFLQIIYTFETVGANSRLFIGS